ncbi:carboxypeptidase-like regulatory domain-containing protein [Nannocystis pusilla]|uniref:carboxypeptidase-like regulatory domain-containing protein n=1 Tax=Nannocystis pusilla TaxID=889268 RepID=UPI003BEFFDDE
MEGLSRCLPTSTFLLGFAALGLGCSDGATALSGSGPSTTTSTTSGSSMAPTSSTSDPPDVTTGEPAPESAAKTPFLLQKVSSATDGVPLARARVTLCPQGVPLTPVPVPVPILSTPASVGVPAEEETPPCRTVFTNADGYFLLEELPVGHATLKVEATGYLPQVDSVTIYGDQRVTGTRKLLPRAATFTFKSNEPAVLAHKGYSVTVPGNTLRDAETHARFVGDVEAEMTMFLPEVHPADSIPAPLVGKELDGRVVDIATLGMLDMTFYGKTLDGRRNLLEIDPEAPARVVFPLPVAANELAFSQVIPLWHVVLDGGTGPGGIVWDQEPEGWRVEEDPNKPGARVAVADVRRFSLINIDWPLTEPVCVKFRVKDKYTQQMIIGAKVTAEVAWQGGTSTQSTYTKINEPVCLNIQKGSTAKYKVSFGNKQVAQGILGPDDFKDTPALCPNDWQKWCQNKCFGSGDTPTPTCAWCMTAQWMDLDDESCQEIEIQVGAPSECQVGSYQLCPEPDNCLGMPGVGVCNEGRRYCVGGEWDQDACSGPSNGWVCAANDPALDEALCGPYENGQLSVDDDCDTLLDDGCPNGCQEGAKKKCYGFALQTLGEDKQGVGECKSGTASCVWDQNLNQGTWPEDDPNTPTVDEACPDQVGPKPENCFNGLDDNCDTFSDCMGTPVYKYGAGDISNNHSASAVDIYPQSSQLVFAVDLYNSNINTVHYGNMDSTPPCFVQADPAPSKQGILVVNLDFNGTGASCQSRGFIRTDGTSLQTRDIAASIGPPQLPNLYSYLLAVGNGKVYESSQKCKVTDLMGAGLLMERMNGQQICTERKGVLVGSGEREAYDMAVSGEHIWIAAMSNRKVNSDCAVTNMPATTKDGVIARFDPGSGCTYALSVTGGSGERRLRSIASITHDNVEYVAVFGSFFGTIAVDNEMIAADGDSTPIIIVYEYKGGKLVYKHHRVIPQTMASTSAAGTHVTFVATSGEPQIVLMGEFSDGEINLNYPLNVPPAKVTANSAGDLFIASYGLDLQYKAHLVPVGDLTELPRFLLPGEETVVVGGDFQNSELDIKGFKAVNSKAGGYDSFATRLRLATLQPVWIRSFGGDGLDQARDGAVNTEGILAIAGTVSGIVSVKIGDKDPPQDHEAGTGRDSFLIVNSP